MKRNEAPSACAREYSSNDVLRYLQLNGIQNWAAPTSNAILYGNAVNDSAIENRASHGLENDTQPNEGGVNEDRNVHSLEERLNEQQRLIEELREEIAGVIATPTSNDTTDQTPDSETEIDHSDTPNPETQVQRPQTDPTIPQTASDSVSEVSDVSRDSEFGSNSDTPTPQNSPQNHPSPLDSVPSPTPAQGMEERLQGVTPPNHSTAQRAQHATPAISRKRTAEMNQEIADHKAELRDILNSPVSAAEALQQTQQSRRDAETSAIEQVIANAGNRTTVHDLATRINRTEAQTAEILAQLKDRDIFTVDENGTYTLQNELDRTFAEQEPNEAVQDAEYTTAEKRAYVNAMNEYFATHHPSKRRNVLKNFIPKNKGKSDTPLWKTKPLIEVKEVSPDIPMSELKKYFQYLSDVAPKLQTPHEIQISGPFNKQEMDDLLSSEEQSPIIGKAKNISEVSLHEERSPEDLAMHQEKIKLLHALQRDIRSSNTNSKVMKARINRFVKNNFAIEPRNEMYDSAATRQEVLKMAEEIVGLSDNDDIKQFIDGVIEQNRGTGENREPYLPKAEEKGIIDESLTIRDMEKLIINDLLEIQNGIDMLKGQYEAMPESVAKTATLEDIQAQEQQMKALVSIAKERGLLQNFNT